MARKVRLRQEWTLGRRIGDPSGFGQVFAATAADGTDGAVKLIPKHRGANRELLFEELAGVPNVVPIIDSGETASAWVIAMPRADRSLRAELEEAGGKLATDVALSVLVDVAIALEALDGRVVHRDLKPENVLLLSGAWCLADFGIARYAEKSTAPETWKAAWSWPYAAPERWQLERATSAADVYALGVIAFELFMGALPFPGPDFDDFRDQHLVQSAPAVVGAPAGVVSLVAECLLKAPKARPTPANVRVRLGRTLTPASAGASRLQAANAAIQAVEAQEEARMSAAASEALRRDAIFKTASLTLSDVSARMRQAIADNAPAAKPETGSFADEWALRLGPAVIGMDPAIQTRVDPWGTWAPSFDVIAHAAIGITIPQDQSGFRGRVHSLWFCDAVSAGVYRWFETGFMVSPLLPRTTEYFPVAFEPSENAGKALANAMTEWQVAWPFTPVDQGEEPQFIERWLEWFGAAATAELRRPSSQPESDPHGSWRRA